MTGISNVVSESEYYEIKVHQQVLKVSDLSIHCNALQGVERSILFAVRFILCIRRLSTRLKRLDL